MRSLAETFFETFQVPALYLQVTAPLALMAAGRTTGLVFDCGEGVTHFAPIWEGQCSKNSVKTMNFAGGDLTRFLGSSLAECSSAGADYFQDIKENKCYVALDYLTEMLAFENDKSKETSFELPDGTTVAFGNQQIRCPEVLFSPSMIGKDFPGVAQATYNTIQACDIDVRRELYENMLLSGGSTMFAGLQDRLTQDVKALANANVNVKCVAPAERKFSVWIGGSTLSTLATFGTMWVTKGEYEEVGVNIVHRKCF